MDFFERDEDMKEVVLELEIEVIGKKLKYKGKYDKLKFWDMDDIEYWKFEKFDFLFNEGGMLEESLFVILFLVYRGIFIKYLGELCLGLCFRFLNFCKVVCN